MPGPQTQHKGVVYGDDEINAPKPNRQPELGPPVRRRPQHTQTGGPRAATPQGLTALRTPDRRNGVRVWGAVHVGTKSRESCPSGSSRAPAYAGPRSRLLPHTPAAGRAEGHAYRPFAARAAGRHRRPQHRCRPPVAEHVVPPVPVLRRRCDAAHRTCPGQADEIA
jgi:hypothetical protein